MKWTVDGSSHGDTRKFAQKIREALYIASLHPKEYPELAAAHAQFSIHVVRKGIVEARIKPQPATVKSRRADEVNYTRTPEHGIQGPTAGFKEVEQVGHTQAIDCITAWREHLPSSDPLLLARTVLSEQEKLKLYTMCRANTPKLMMLVGEDHITLSLYEAEVANLAAWSPPAQPAAPEEFAL